jgi:hypothetical protein
VQLTQSGDDAVAAHAAAVVPTTHVAPLQHPPWQALLAEHVVPQTPAVHASPIGQSACVLQPQAPLGRHAVPDVPAVQSTHAPPDAPHALLATASHVFAGPQQKPEPHVAAAPLVPHVAVHAPAAHVGVPKPHAEHAPPFDPHSPFAVPGTHLLVAPSQHPPLHTRLAHDVEHTPVPGSHAWPVGHWLEVAHPPPSRLPPSGGRESGASISIASSPASWGAASAASGEGASRAEASWPPSANAPSAPPSASV